MAETGIVDYTTPFKTLFPHYGILASTSGEIKDPLIGIEFENELNFNKTPITGFESWPAIANWKYHQENSLRYYGFEHVSRPMKISGYKKQVEFLFSKMLDIINSKSQKPFKELPFTNSIRTSVHVHFDVGSMTPLQVLLFVTLYWIMEPYLQQYCGSWRQGNLFCLRLLDSSFMKILLSDCLVQKKMYLKTSITGESYRYGSVNFNALQKFGTIEFRLMRGVNKPREAYNWIDALEAIRLFSLKFNSTNSLKDYFMKEISARDLPKEVLGKDLQKVYHEALENPTGVGELIQTGWLSVLPIISQPTLWSEEYLADLRKKEEAQRGEMQSPWAEKLLVKGTSSPYIIADEASQVQSSMFSAPSAPGAWVNTIIPEDPPSEENDDDDDIDEDNDWVDDWDTPEEPTDEELDEIENEG